MKGLRIKPAKKISGEIRVPSDKSISHRAVILSSAAAGTSKIKNFLKSDDSTLKAVSSLGAIVKKSGDDLLITGCPCKTPPKEIYCGNSGTTMRLLTGLISGRPLTAVLTGDKSLSQRPMKRIILPLEKMGAKIRSRNGFPPLAVKGGKLKAIQYRLPVASAQVKTAVLLAGLNARGTTKIFEKIPSRDHTARMMPLFGVKITKKSGWIEMRGGQKLKSANVKIPGDISSASFFITAAALLKSVLKIKEVGINPTRCGFLKALEKMGLKYKITNRKFFGLEPVADIIIKGTCGLRAAKFTKKDVPAMIDEIPLLALCATAAEGKTVITGAEELKVKECDRLSATYSQLKKMGAKIRKLKDGFEISGPVKLKGTEVHSYDDHRITMMLALAGLTARGDTLIDDAGSISVSFPGFLKNLYRLTK